MEPEYDIQMCQTGDGHIPIQEWLDSLDITMRARVRIQIDRMEDGGFGDVEPIGGGASEKKLHFGPAIASISQLKERSYIFYVAAARPLNRQT